jgi:hypothetical protein
LTGGDGGDLSRDHEQVDRRGTRRGEEPGDRGPDNVSDQDGHPEGAGHRHDVERPGVGKGLLGRVLIELIGARFLQRARRPESVRRDGRTILMSQ